MCGRDDVLWQGRAICLGCLAGWRSVTAADALDAARRLGAAERDASPARLDQDGLVMRIHAWRHDPACPGVTYRRPIRWTVAGRPAWQFVPPH